MLHPQTMKEKQSDDHKMVDPSITENRNWVLVCVRAAQETSKILFLPSETACVLPLPLGKTFI